MKKLNDGPPSSKYNQLMKNDHFEYLDHWAPDPSFYLNLPKVLIMFSQMHHLLLDWRDKIQEQRDQILENWRISIKETDKYNEGHSDINPKEVQVLEHYFNKKMSPKNLSNKFKMARSKIYKLIKETKVDINKIEVAFRRRDNKRIYKSSIWTNMIKEYVESHKFKYFTLEHIRKHLISWTSPEQVPSIETIRKILKHKLLFSYKKINTRPLKLIIDNRVSDRLCFINFYSKLIENKIKIIQIDEFSVNSSVTPSRAWVPKGKSGFVWVGETPKNFNIIIAICEDNVVFYKISHSNTNSEVFISFIRELKEKLREDSESNETNYILSLDNASYHKSNLAKSFLIRENIKAFTNVPYTPEFTAVELWINWIKNNIRKELRLGR